VKKLSKFVGLVGAFALGTAIVSAAPAGDSMRVNVPFSFVLAGKVFPAGYYTVQQSDSGMLLVSGQGTAAIALTIPGDAVKTGSLPALRFAPSNGHEYLVAVDNDTMSRTVPTGVAETRTLALSH
jgi:hypothetical protein